jgi:hypothetical protein
MARTAVIDGKHITSKTLLVRHFLPPPSREAAKTIISFADQVDFGTLDRDRDRDTGSLWQCTTCHAVHAISTLKPRYFRCGCGENRFKKLWCGGSSSRTLKKAF